MASCASRRGADAGFALIEALVALALLALVFAVLLQAGAGAARRLAEAEAIAFANLSAQSVLAATGIEAPLVPGTRRGALPQGFAWTETITTLPGTPLPGQARARAITVVVHDASGQPRATLSTVRLAPP